MEKGVSRLRREKIEELVVFFRGVDLLLKQTVGELSRAAARAGEKGDVREGVTQEISVAAARPSDGAAELQEALVFAGESSRNHAGCVEIRSDDLEQRWLRS